MAHGRSCGCAPPPAPAVSPAGSGEPPPSPACPPPFGSGRTDSWPGPASPGLSSAQPAPETFQKMFAQFSQSVSIIDEQCNSFVSISFLTIWLLNMQHKIWLIQTTKKVQNQEVCTDLSLPQFGFKFGFLAALPLLYLHLLPLVSATSGKLQDSEVKFICRTVLEEIPFYEQQFKCCR